MSNSSIRVIFATQYLENYGSHDWDGEGDCPQHWKPKGGSTYIVSASAEDIAMSTWWDIVERAIETSNDCEREYIIDQKIVDAIDFVESDYVDFYEAPTFMAYENGVLHCERNILNLSNEVVATRFWEQDTMGVQNSRVEEYAQPVVVEWRREKEMALHGVDEQFEELEALMGDA